jgi:hypothetical protein
MLPDVIRRVRVFSDVTLLMLDDDTCWHADQADHSPTTQSVAVPSPNCTTSQRSEHTEHCTPAQHSVHTRKPSALTQDIHEPVTHLMLVRHTRPQQPQLSRVQCTIVHSNIVNLAHKRVQQVLRCSADEQRGAAEWDRARRAACEAQRTQHLSSSVTHPATVHTQDTHCLRSAHRNMLTTSVSMAGMKWTRSATHDAQHLLKTLCCRCLPAFRDTQASHELTQKHYTANKGAPQC